jgi:1-acyl-sn-glycerol-3-phosphate acyltransferase
VVLCNHRSYFDTTATDAALAWAGEEALANRLAAVAGPKVYADLFRRFAAACLNTVPAPQSTALEGTARLAARDLARRALESVATAHRAIADGHVLLLYPEGSRTRTGRLRPFLKAVHRYLAVDGLFLVPAVILGSERVMPIDADRLHPAPVALRFAAPLSVAAAGGPRGALEAAHAAIAALLPPPARPAPGEPAVT